MLQLPARTIIELDEMAGFPPVAAGGEAEIEKADTCCVRHGLAEPNPPPKRLSLREERAANKSRWIFPRAPMSKHVDAG